MEDPSLQLLTPAPPERLEHWLGEFYGKPVTIKKRELLRHRDLSLVERLTIADALPETLIYKLVLPPWDVEQDLHERVLIPSVSNSAQLYLTGHYGNLTALFLEDLGNDSLITYHSAEIAARVGKELAKQHRSYIYRIDELLQSNILPAIVPLDYAEITQTMVESLRDWGLIDGKQAASLHGLASLLAGKLAGEAISLVHGDLYAENLIWCHNRLFIIDWSWFTFIGVPLMDLATLTMEHPKNAGFHQYRNELLDAYCFEYGRELKDLVELLPYGETLSRLLFLRWLVERKNRGINGTTQGPVDNLMIKVIQEIEERQRKL